MNNDICWYHPKLTREEAEELLKNEGAENGVFIVRNSNSSIGDYVLSVYYNDDVTHFQIRKHTEDAFFSIAETKKFHGLEVLIEHYSQPNNGLPDNLVLKNFIKGELPPDDVRRLGHTRLLHRAVSQCNLKVVLELLKAGHKHENKNQHGQTAVHIAAIIGQNDVLNALIQFGASVNLRDTSGQTPLHYACQNGFPATVRILVMNGANIQARNMENDSVPLHDAASRGHKDVVRELLSLNAPARPRNKDKLTPAQLARINGYDDCAEMLENYRAPTPKTDRHKWYHGTLNRTEAENLIRKHCNQTGTYLIRFSERNKEKVLTLLYEKVLYNFIIRSEKGYLFIDDGPYLDSLEHIVEYYSMISDGLPTVLLNPVPPKPKPPVPFDTMPRPKKTKAKPSLESTNTTPTSQLSDIEFKSNFRILSLDNINNNNESEDYIPLDRLTKGKIIGGGEFGSVYEGTYIDKKGEMMKVAIKTLHDDMVTMEDAFLQEAKVMMNLHHPNIVRFIGLSSGPPLQMVQELVELGSIQTYMETHRDKIRPNYEFKIWAAQIAEGMNYLEGEKFVHRDLAARNILLATPTQIKISDFGLSRAIGSEQYYRASTGGKWPLKWYAPESYNYGQFSHKSDVWSFGVTIWEMFAFGEAPWGDMKGADAILLIDAGQRLKQPEACPDHIYDIMLKCWDSDPNKRPTFSELVEFFTTEPDYMNIMNIRELIK